MASKRIIKELLVRSRRGLDRTRVATRARCAKRDLKELRRWTVCRHQCEVSRATRTRDANGDCRNESYKNFPRASRESSLTVALVASTRRTCKRIRQRAAAPDRARTTTYFTGTRPSSVPATRPIKEAYSSSLFTSLRIIRSSRQRSTSRRRFTTQT